jgi:phosphoglycolate phosphatase-like HAD superfamily hydrolase
MYDYPQPSPEFSVLFDYDGTMGDTGEPSPNGWNVEKACRAAIQEVLGEKGAAVFDSQGGLKSRAPTEIIEDMIAQDPSLVSEGRNFFLQNQEMLLQDRSVQQGKGVPLEWRENDQMPGRVIAEMFVRRKLAILLPEICAEWPKPCKGFLEFWSTLQQLKENGIHFITGVVTSGHDEFINRTFKEWRMKDPDFMVSEDQIRGIHPHHPHKVQEKPGPLPIFLALAKIAELRHQCTGEGVILTPFLETRMVFAGDSPSKDMVMAQRNGLPAVHFNRDAEKLTVDPDNRAIRFGDWQHFADFLLQNEPLFREGLPIESIFKNHREGMVFMERIMPRVSSEGQHYGHTKESF